MILVPKLNQRPVNRLVRRNVEVFFVDLLDHFRNRGRGSDEHGTEHTLLRFHAVGESAVNIR
jgi:hypothetical protein